MPASRNASRSHKPSRARRQRAWPGMALWVVLGALVVVAVQMAHLGRSTPAGQPPWPAVRAAVPSGAAPALQAAPAASRPFAQFGAEPASAQARQIANWALYSGDNCRLAVVVVDKKDAKVFVFGRGGKLRGAAPALLGSAIGGHSVRGIGDKPIAQVLPAERTTPAGRFVAEPGLNASGEDVVWVDYEAAVSMHRVRAHVKAERRLQRLAFQAAQDNRIYNRISFGCIDVPVAFYEQVLSPTVRSTGAVVYVLPKTQPAGAFFGAYDVPASGRLAQQGARAPVRHAQRSGMTPPPPQTPSVDATGAVAVVGTAVAQSAPPNTPSTATGTSAGSGTSTPNTNATGTGTHSTSQQSVPLGSSGTSGAGSNPGTTRPMRADRN